MDSYENPAVKRRSYFRLTYEDITTRIRKSRKNNENWSLS